MTNRVVTFFEKVGGIFKKLFGSKATWEQTALATIKVVGPMVEILLSVINPGVGDEATSIINEIKADLTVLYSLAQTGAVSGTTTGGAQASQLIQSINTNMSTLLADAHVKNPATVARVTDVSNDISQEMTALLSNIPVVMGNPPTAADVDTIKSV